jgi:hypothetical protein
MNEFFEYNSQALDGLLQDHLDKGNFFEQEPRQFKNLPFISKQILTQSSQLPESIKLTTAPWTSTQSLRSSTTTSSFDRNADSALTIFSTFAITILTLGVLTTVVVLGVLVFCCCKGCKFADNYAKKQGTAPDYSSRRVEPAGPIIPVMAAQAQIVKPATQPVSQCSLCQGSLTAAEHLPCGHSFHRACLKSKSYSGTADCPLCNFKPVVYTV